MNTRTTGLYGADADATVRSLQICIQQTSMATHRFSSNQCPSSRTSLTLQCLVRTVSWANSQKDIGGESWQKIILPATVRTYGIDGAFTLCGSTPAIPPLQKRDGTYPSRVLCPPRKLTRASTPKFLAFRREHQHPANRS